VAICRQSPYLRPVPSATHYDVILIMTSFATKPAILIILIMALNSLQCADMLLRNYSLTHYDVIPIMTSFATKLATPGITDGRTYGHLTAFNI